MHDVTHIVAVTFLSCVSVAQAEWDSVSYHFTAGEANTVDGPGKAFRTTRPADGTWTASFGASNHFANLRRNYCLVLAASQSPLGPVQVPGVEAFGQDRTTLDRTDGHGSGDGAIASMNRSGCPSGRPKGECWVCSLTAE